MMTVDHFLLLIDPFCEARGIAPSTLSFHLFRDGKRIKAMREKRSDVGSRRLMEAFQWLSDRWPESAEWPADVPRPAPAASAVEAAA